MKTPVAIAEVDPAELAIRMCEANYGIIRPMPDAAQALAAMEAECRNAWLRSARAATDYFIEIINDARTTQ